MFLESLLMPTSLFPWWQHLHTMLRTLVLTEVYPEAGADVSGALRTSLNPAVVPPYTLLQTQCLPKRLVCFHFSEAIPHLLLQSEWLPSKDREVWLLFLPCPQTHQLPLPCPNNFWENLILLSTWNDIFDLLVHEQWNGEVFSFT